MESNNILFKLQTLIINDKIEGKLKIEETNLNKYI